MKKNNISWIFVLEYASIIILLSSIFISLGYCLNFGGIDFTNRVQGSRLLMETDLNPYTFKWDKSFDVRYYDPSDWDEEKVNVNRCTATPFFLFIFYPFAAIPYGLARIIWFIVEWLLIFLTIKIMLGKEFKNKILRSVVFIFIALFPAFLVHVEHGQLYTLITFFIALLIKSFLDNKSIQCSFFFSILFLLSPPILIFILPIIFFDYKKALKIFSYFLIFLVFWIVILNLFGITYDYWINYFNAMKLHEDVHFLFSHFKIHKNIDGDIANSELIQRTKTVLNTLDRSVKGVFYNAFNIRIYSKTLSTIYSLIILLPYILFKMQDDQTNKKKTIWEFIILYYSFMYFIPAPRYLYHEVILIIPFILLLKNYLLE